MSKDETQTSLPELEVKETSTFDVNKYVGMKSTIAEIKIEKGKFGSMIKLESEVLGTEDENEIKASMIFSLKDTKDGLVIPEKGDLNQFMKNKKVTDYRDLKTMPITILSKVDGKGIDWLIFS